MENLSCNCFCRDSNHYSNPRDRWLDLLSIRMLGYFVSQTSFRISPHRLQCDGGQCAVLWIFFCGWWCAILPLFRAHHLVGLVNGLLVYAKEYVILLAIFPLIEWGRVYKGLLICVYLWLVCTGFNIAIEYRCFWYFRNENIYKIGSLDSIDA